MRRPRKQLQRPRKAQKRRPPEPRVCKRATMDSEILIGFLGINPICQETDNDQALRRSPGGPRSPKREDPRSPEAQKSISNGTTKSWSGAGRSLHLATTSAAHVIPSNACASCPAQNRIQALQWPLCFRFHFAVSCYSPT